MLKHRYAPLAFGIIVIAAIAAWMAAYRSSPGDLAAPHAAVAGSSFVGDCRKCHAAKGLTAGCLSCHAEIAGQLERKTGYHGKTIAAKAAACGKCHSDHNGREFKLINKMSWGGQEPKTFTHDEAVFTLKGKHAALACASCHKGTERRPSSYLGLAQDCVACHKDPHQGGKLTDCVKCHSQDGWKPAPGFDHDKFYPLRDKHASVSCAKCHLAAPGAAAAAAAFGPVKGKSCRDCHATPHRTDWGLACASCHTERAVAWSAAAARFTRAQHEASGFSLRKPHDRAACAKCHDASRPYASRFAPVRGSCEACHKDPHAGQFAAKQPRCDDCHSAEGFKPSKLGIKDHPASYPLLGAHAAAACAACHARDAALGAARFAGTPRECASCHRDPHAGQFRAPSGRTRCETCHADPSSWKTLVFDHDRARFKLDAAHKDVSCKECHPTVQLKDGRRIVQYKPVKTGCGDCHETKR